MTKFTCIICYDVKEVKNVSKVLFLWNDGLNKGCTVCKPCANTIPVSKWLWKRFRYTEVYWKYQKKRTQEKIEKRIKEEGLGKWLK